MITVETVGSYCHKWQFEFEGSLYFGWERTEDDARAEAEWTLERLKNGEEVDLE
jgi:hypothetical protein